MRSSKRTARPSRPRSTASSGSARAALLSPALQPPEGQYPLQVELPTYLREYRDAVRAHPAARWAQGIYRQHRGRSAEIPRQRVA
jgi:hypothetical protein